MTEGREEDPAGLQIQLVEYLQVVEHGPPLTGFVNTIDYVTIASTGDAVRFW